MYLRCDVHDSPKTWKAWLALAELWYNSSLHTSLDCSPFKALYGYEPNLGAVPSIQQETSPQVPDIIEHRELHLQSLKQHLARAQNRMKLLTDQKHQDFQFSVGDKVLLKLQPYTQSSVARRPYPKLAFKYYGPYTVMELVGSVAYRLQLPEGSLIHPIFHISQLKPFSADYTPVYDSLLATTDLEVANTEPEKIIDRRLVKKGNTAIPQAKLSWVGLPESATTWEDYHVVKHRFPNAPAWGQAGSSAGGGVTPGGDH